MCRDRCTHVNYDYRPHIVLVLRGKIVHNCGALERRAQGGSVPHIGNAAQRRIGGACSLVDNAHRLPLLEKLPDQLRSNEACHADDRDQPAGHRRLLSEAGAELHQDQELKSLAPGHKTIVNDLAAIRPENDGQPDLYCDKRDW